MTSKFSPKFTLVTPYPMMFSSADLRHIELEILHVILPDEVSCRRHLSDLSHVHDSEWLHLSKHELELSWKISLEDITKKELKRPEKT